MILDTAAVPETYTGHTPRTRYSPALAACGSRADWPSGAGGTCAARERENRRAEGSAGRLERTAPGTTVARRRHPIPTRRGAARCPSGECRACTDRHGQHECHRAGLRKAAAVSVCSHQRRTPVGPFARSAGARPQAPSLNRVFTLRFPLNTSMTGIEPACPAHPLAHVQRTPAMTRSNVLFHCR